MKCLLAFLSAARTASSPPPPTALLILQRGSFGARLSNRRIPFSGISKGCASWGLAMAFHRVQIGRIEMVSGRGPFLCLKLQVYVPAISGKI